MRRASALAWVCLLLMPHQARAEGESTPAQLPGDLRVLLPLCSPLPFDPTELLSVLRVELLPYGTSLDEASLAATAEEPRAVVSVDAPCEESAGFELRITHLPSERTVSERYTLDSGTPRERSRVVALALVELLRRWWAPLCAGPTAAPGPPAEEQAPVVASAPRAERSGPAAGLTARAGPRERRARGAPLLFGAVGAALYPSEEGAYYGLRLGGSWDLVRPFEGRLEVDARWTFTAVGVPQGRVYATTLAGAAAFLFWGGSSVLRIGGGPRLELGWVRAWGAPSSPEIDARSHDEMTVSIAAQLSFRARLGARVWLLAGGFAGVVALGLTPQVGPLDVAGLSGPFLGLDVGIAMEL